MNILKVIEGYNLCENTSRVAACDLKKKKKFKIIE